MLAHEALKAASNIYHGAWETPLQPADWLSQATGAQVLLKLENKQVWSVCRYSKLAPIMLAAAV